MLIAKKILASVSTEDSVEGTPSPESRDHVRLSPGGGPRTVSSESLCLSTSGRTSPMGLARETWGQRSQGPFQRLDTRSLLHLVPFCGF